MICLKSIFLKILNIALWRNLEKLTPALFFCAPWHTPLHLMISFYLEKQTHILDIFTSQKICVPFVNWITLSQWSSFSTLLLGPSLWLWLLREKHVGILKKKHFALFPTLLPLWVRYLGSLGCSTERQKASISQSKISTRKFF